MNHLNYRNNYNTVFYTPLKSLSFFSSFLQIQEYKKKTVLFNYESISDVVTFFLLIITTLLVVLTPLILITCWVYFSRLYIKNYRRLFSLNKWIRKKSYLDENHLDLALWSSFRFVYAPMVGFGLSILAYTVSSFVIMAQNFNSMGTAISQYLKFPFLVLDNIGWITIEDAEKVNIDAFWNQMLLVVVISALFFLIGYLLGSFFTDLRYNLLKRKQEKSPARSIKIKEDVFHLNLKKEESLESAR